MCPKLVKALLSKLSSEDNLKAFRIRRTSKEYVVYSKPVKVSTSIVDPEKIFFK